VCSEVTVYSERQHVAVVFGDADMAKLETELNNNGIKVGPFTDCYVPFGCIFLIGFFHCDKAGFCLSGTVMVYDN
jgi:hypothetical protein